MTDKSEQKAVRPVADDRPIWRAPQLSQDTIADATKNISNSPGDDGFDTFPGYDSSGVS